MSSETPAAVPETPESWPALSALERRILGVLVEKAKTTPDAYPMSVNALVTGCNQKSNRDPVMTVDEADADEMLVGLQTRGLAIKITGGRVVRWRHQLYDRWQVNKVELALLAELLLRGPQTEGELRSRASRMEPIDELEQLRQALRPLAERTLVRFLGPEGRRGTLIAHGFYTPQELEVLHASQGRADEQPPAATHAAAAVSANPSQLAALQEEVQQALGEIAALQARLRQAEEVVEDLRRQVQTLRESLGA
jgi:uncharacterized protein YceH (UPF0502 family)